MSEEKNDGGSALKVGLELVKQTYEDGPKAIVQEVGKFVVRPLKLLNACFANIDLAIQDHEGRQRLLEQRLADKWAAIPQERLVAPPALVAGPLLFNYVFVQEAGAEPLRELYEQLLASAMDSAEQPLVHPSFVDMLRQMTPAEARVIRFMKAIRHQQPLVRVEQHTVGERGARHIADHHFLPPDVLEQGSFALLENLARLGLVEISFTMKLVASPDPYEGLTKAALALYPTNDKYFFTGKEGMLALTALGIRFVRCCVRESASGAGGAA